jgi:multisubunit Na+/H+ antiporter MnhB subunit
MHQSFLSIARYRYGLYGCLLCVASAGCYIVDSWHERPGGGTVLGYTLGGIAAALVLFLMSYGIRRRSFRGRAGSTKQWLSMHVYFGLSVLIVATLHSGLQFGYNVHTLSFGLLCVVVLSGCWGVYAYLRYPTLMARERGEAGRDELLTRLAEVDRQALAVSANLEPEVNDLIADAILRTRLGGDIWAQLRGRDQSMLLLTPVREWGYSRMVSNRGQEALIAQLAKYESTSHDAEAQHTLRRLLQISGDKAVLLRRLQRDIQLQGLLQAWLYLHLPLSFAMLAALVVHVFSVFYYW